MTILTTGPRVDSLRRVSEVLAQPPSSVKHTNGLSATDSMHATPRPAPSDLLSGFIEQFRELEAYK
jgi:hypothetical protein